jgi:hypothetical protein
VYLARMLKSRLLEHDKYIDTYKILDHFWRKWILADFRPMWSLFSKDTDDVITTTPSGSKQKLPETKVN